MDGFQGYATAAGEVIPKATQVMDPFHVVCLAGDKLTMCSTRLQLETTGRRGRSKDPPYHNRKTLLTTEHLLTDKQRGRLEELFDFDDDAPLIKSPAGTSARGSLAKASTFSKLSTRLGDKRARTSFWSRDCLKLERKVAD